MIWNYRVVEKDDGLGGRWLEIHSAYYSSKGSERPRSISQNAAAPCGDDIDELRQCLQRMINALDKPVLQYEDF